MNTKSTSLLHGLKRDLVTRHAIMIGTPDLLSQHLVCELLKQLALHEIYPVAVIPYKFTDAESFMLYNGRVTHKTSESRLHSNWLSPRLFTGGVSLVFILRTLKETASLQEYLCTIKGRSRMGEYSSDDLRGISRLVDRSFSLIHSADDYHSFFHESELILGWPIITASIDSRREILSEKIVNSLAPNLKLCDEANIFTVLPKVFGQVISLLLCDPSTAICNKKLQILLTKIDLLNDQISICPNDNKLTGILWSGIELFRAEVEELFDSSIRAINWADSFMHLKRSLNLVKLLDIMIECCRRDTFDPAVSLTFVAALRDCHLPISQWDEHRLHVIAAYHGGGPE